MLHRSFALLVAGVMLGCSTVNWFSPIIRVEAINVRVSVNNRTPKESENVTREDKEGKRPENRVDEAEVEAEFELIFENEEGQLETTTTTMAFILAPHGEAAPRSQQSTEGAEVEE